jgi:HD-GYP domain-containing protein (c-di-GMP phosphodiesterase class II)
MSKFMAKTTELDPITRRVAEIMGEFYHLAYVRVDSDLRIVCASPNFPPSWSDADLTQTGLPLVDAFCEFVGMDEMLYAILRGELPGLQIERINRLQPDGATRYLTFRVLPFDAAQPQAGLLLIAEDVTRFGLIEHSLLQSRNELRLVKEALDRTNAELDHRVEQRTQELAQAKHQIEQQLFRLQALRTNDLAILGTTDLRVALKTIADQARRQLFVDVAAIFLLDPHSLRFENLVVQGANTPEISSLRIRLGETIIGRAALERQPIIIPDLRYHPPYDVVGKIEGFAACFVVPLIAKGNVVGVMYLGNRSVMQIDQDWLDFLEALAGQAAMAIESIKAFENLQRSNFELSLAYSRTIEGWSHALDLRDRETNDHTFRVTEVTLQLARAAGIKDTELMHIKHGALLHDIGKMGVPDAILLKEDYLSNEEREIMRRHPIYAYEMLSPIEYLRPALEIPYCHHEKWDGTGYPRGLAGEQIPLAARLFAIVDVWDALRSDRPYRRGWPEDKVREYIASQAGSHFDPRLVEIFMRVLAERDQDAVSVD